MTNLHWSRLDDRHVPRVPLTDIEFSKSKNERIFVDTEEGLGR